MPVHDEEVYIRAAQIWVAASLALIVASMAGARIHVSPGMALVISVVTYFGILPLVVAMYYFYRMISRQRIIGAPIGSMGKREPFYTALLLFGYAMIIGMISVTADFLEDIVSGPVSWLLYIPDEASIPVIVYLLAQVFYIVFSEISDIGRPILARKISTPVSIVVAGIILVAVFAAATTRLYRFHGPIASPSWIIDVLSSVAGVLVGLHLMYRIARLRIRFFMADYVDITLAAIHMYLGFQILDLIESFLYYSSATAFLVYHMMKLVMAVGAVMYGLIVTAAAVDLYLGGRMVIGELLGGQRIIAFEIATGEVARAYTTIAAYVRTLAYKRGVAAVHVFGWRPPRLYQALRLVLGKETRILYCSVMPGVSFPQVSGDKCLVGPEASHILHVYLEEKNRSRGASMIIIDGLSESVVLIGLTKTIDMVSRISHNMKKDDIMVLIYDREMLEPEHVPALRALADTLIELS